MKIIALNPPNIASHYINRDLMGGMGVSMTAQKMLSERVMTYLKARSIRLPVMSLAYCATILQESFEVTVIDAANLDLSPEATRRQIEVERPDWVLSTTSISSLKAEAEFLAEIRREQGVAVGLMGDAATQFADELLREDACDFIIRGNEPELVVREIAARRTFENIKGVIRIEGGRIEDGGDPGAIQDLDSLPVPDWSLFPVHAYRYFPILRQRPFLPVLSSRGCPYGCIYCPYTSNQGPRFRHRSVQGVVDELVQLQEQHQVRGVQFRDPTFTISKKRAHRICDGMLEQRLGIEWGCETRVDCLDEELIDKMVEAGLRGVNIGIESTDRGVIRQLERGWIDPALIERTVRLLVDRGVRVSGFFILGLPGESRKTIEETIAFACALPLSYAEFKIATPYPGTPLAELAKERGWIESIEAEALPALTGYTPSMRISDELDGPYLKSTENRAYRAFYSRPVRLLKEVLRPSFLRGFLDIVWTSNLIGRWVKS